MTDVNFMALRLSGAREIEKGRLIIRRAFNLRINSQKGDSQSRAPDGVYLILYLDILHSGFGHRRIGGHPMPGNTQLLA